MKSKKLTSPFCSFKFHFFSAGSLNFVTVSTIGSKGVHFSSCLQVKPSLSAGSCSDFQLDMLMLFSAAAYGADRLSKSQSQLALQEILSQTRHTALTCTHRTVHEPCRATGQQHQLSYFTNPNLELFWSFNGCVFSPSAFMQRVTALTMFTID